MLQFFCHHNLHFNSNSHSCTRKTAVIPETVPITNRDWIFRVTSIVTAIFPL